MAPSETIIPKNFYKYIVVLFLLTLILRIILLTYYNSNFGGIEQNVIYGIQRIVMGQPLYQDPNSGSYAVMQYTPLYYHFIGEIAKLADIHATDVQDIYVICRVFALLFNILTVFTVALIIRSFGFSALHSLIFAMPVLLLLTNHYYTRGDSMHLFLFVAAFYSYLLFTKKGGVQYLIMAALFSAGCIMVKQSGVLVTGIIGFCLLFQDRKLFMVLLYGLFTTGFAYLIVAACVHGSWNVFYQNAYLGLKNGSDPSFLLLIFTNQFFLDMVPCYVLGGIMVWLAIKKVENKTYRILGVAICISFLFAVVTGLKIGSSNNYFTEFLLFVVAATPYVLQSKEGERIVFSVSQKAMTIRRFTYMAILILITSKTVGFFTEVYIEKRIKNDKEEYAREMSLHEHFKKELNLTDGEYIFFADRLFFDNIFVENAIMPNKDIVKQIYAASHTTYNYEHFIAGMNSGMIKYIVITENKSDINEWNRYIPFIHFDKDKFKVLGSYAGCDIYVYSPAAL